MKWVAAAMVIALAAAACERKIAGGSADGAEVFREACARCHGEQGVPARAEVVRLGVKDLSKPEVQDRLSDADIERQIRRGSDNQNMPAFAGALSDDQVEAVIRHVRTLRRNPAPR